MEGVGLRRRRWDPKVATAPAGWASPICMSDSVNVGRRGPDGPERPRARSRPGRAFSLSGRQLTRSGRQSAVGPSWVVTGSRPTRRLGSARRRAWVFVQMYSRSTRSDRSSPCGPGTSGEGLNGTQVAPGPSQTIT